MARPHFLEDEHEGEARRELVATMLADGATSQQIADAFGHSKRTVQEWRKRADVQAKVTNLIQQRSNNILAHTDTKILARLQQGKEIPMPDLLQIRRTYAGEKITVENVGDQGRAMAELMQALHEEPEKARLLAAPDDIDAD